MALCIAVLVATVAHHVQGHILTKPFMECDAHQWTQWFPSDASAQTYGWTSLVHFCGNYDHGMGMFCKQVGGNLDPHVFWPLGSVNRRPDGASLRWRCIVNCWCMERRLDDDTATITGSQTEALSSAEVDDDASIIYAGEALQPVGSVVGYYVDPEESRGVQCRYSLGRVNYADCREAIHRLNEVEPASEWKEVFVCTSDPILRHLAAGGRTFEIPWRKTVRTCTVEVKLNPTVHHRYDFEVIDYIEARLRAINYVCGRAPLGIGGWAKAGSYNKAILVRLYGSDGSLDNSTRVGHPCSAEQIRDQQCSSESSASDANRNGYTGNTDEEPSKPGESSLAPQCGTTCAHQDHCGSRAEGCFCAGNFSDTTSRNHAINGFPVSATWGSMMCQSAATLAALSTLYQVVVPVSRRRFILETNGTLAIASGKTIPGANDSVASDGGLELLPDDLTQYPSTLLFCPCNCTYVSYACCLSLNGLVYEDASAKANLTLSGPPGQCCDSTTGNWTAVNGETRRDPSRNTVC